MSINNQTTPDKNYPSSESKIINSVASPLNEEYVLLTVGYEATFMPTIEGIPAMGYLEAGHILSEYLHKKNGRQDSLVHPILFCYRHYFELALKDQIHLTLSRMHEVYYPKRDNHDLLKLFSKFRELTEEEVLDVSGPEESIMYDLLEAYVKELQEFDKDASLFRYSIPHSKDQGYRKQINLSLTTLRMRIDEMAGWLSSLYSWWDENHPWISPDEESQT